MCKAFSCIIHKNKTVTWKFGIDSHEDLITIVGYKDDKDDPIFARVEISPKNGNYLDPEVPYIFKLDEKRTPSWWSISYENKCWDAQEQWLKKLNCILIRKQIIHPFQIIPPEITEEHIQLLKDWDSVWDSVRASVWASVWASVRASVWASVRASMRASVWASVRAYTGSFFLLPRDAWKYTENIKTDEYPFLPVVKLWEQGLVPSFDGKTWRLHGGKGAKILYEWVK